MKIRDLIIQIIFNFAVLLGTFSVLGISIPLLIIYASATLIWRFAELISTITKSIWNWVMDKYKDLLNVLDD